MLRQFIESNRDEIVARCQSKVAARSTSQRIDQGGDHGVPVFLTQLGEALRLGTAGAPGIAEIAIKHGKDLRQQGFTVSQVVHDYGDVCQTITEMAIERSASITSRDFRTLNACLDNAIAGAVTEFGRVESQSIVDAEAARGNERLGFLAHELRNLTNTAILAFNVLKTGNVGIAGSTGGVLQRSLNGLRVLVGQSFDKVRQAHVDHTQSSFLVSEFIQEIEPTAMQDAHALGVTLVVLPVEDGVKIEADRQVLASALVNVLQNAFKFTKPHTTVTLRVVTDLERVHIEVEDECGGLPRGNVEQLFRSFEQRGGDRTGLGLGLAFCRWAVEASDGRINARSLPGQGCVFTIDMPRRPVAVDVAAVTTV